MSQFRPEVLAPAGCLQRLKTAVTFGADAVYIGGQQFSLRKQADNFNATDMAAAIAFAHEHGAKVYVTCNIMPLQRDWAELAPYVQQLQDLQPDAVIVADPGVAHYFHNETDIRIHVSTQASVTHADAAAMWKARGAKRVVLAREVALEEAAAIQNDVGVEVECFVHGAMCASYSGKCVISNYTAGRDANRGGCVQTCRHPFTVHEGTGTASDPLYQAPIMNARDLMALSLIPKFSELGIGACKIEGRMKSVLYVAATVAAYRQACDGVPVADIAAGAVLQQLSNRSFGTGGLQQRPFSASINSDFEGYTGGLALVGQCLAWDDARGAYLHLRSDLEQGDTLCWLLPDGSIERQTVQDIRDASGQQQVLMKSNRMACVPHARRIPAFSVAWVERSAAELNYTSAAAKAQGAV